jgi:hypothetical protein
MKFSALVLISLFSTACATATLPVEGDNVPDDGKEDSASVTQTKVFARARDLGVELGLAVPSTKQNLAVELEDETVTYVSEATLNRRVASVYWVKITGATGDTSGSRDFARAAIVVAPKIGTIDAIVLQADKMALAPARKAADIEAFARDLGVKLTLAGNETKQNLEVTAERDPANYQSPSTANQRVATAFFAKIVMDTGASRDFARVIIIDSAKLPTLVSVPVQISID